MSDIVEQLRKHSDPTYPDDAPCPLLKKAADEIARLRERVRVLREECAASRCALKADGTTFPMGYRQKQRYINARSATDAAKAMEDKCPPTT